MRCQNSQRVCLKSCMHKYLWFNAHSLHLHFADENRPKTQWSVFKIFHNEFHHADTSIVCDVIFALVVVVSILLAFCLFCYWVAHTAVPIILFCNVFVRIKDIHGWSFWPASILRKCRFKIISMCTTALNQKISKDVVLVFQCVCMCIKSFNAVVSLT